MGSEAKGAAVQQVPEVVRFFFSGVIGTALDYLAYKAIYDAKLFPVFRATLSWALAYFLSVIWQHSLHAFFVFGGYGPQGYFRSLGTMYVAYSGSILFSPCINWTLVEYAKLDHNMSFVATLLITGLANYLLLTKSMGSNANASDAIMIFSGGVPIDAMRAQQDRKLHPGKPSSNVVIGAPAKATGCVLC